MIDGKIAIIGDVHGHADELTAKLIDLGMDPETLMLPEDLTVIQLGDLIHKGLQSHVVLHMVDTIMNQQPHQWIQLIGNHEAQYVYEKLFEWDDELNDDDADILRKWLRNGKLHAAAYTITPAGNEALITHAGLNYDVWKIVLGRPRSAREAAARINAGIYHKTAWLWAPGEMLQGVPNRMAGPLWTSATAELYPSWLNAEAMEVPAPFSQVHGHSSLFNWGNNWVEPGFREADLSLGTDEQAAEVRSRARVNTDARHLHVRLAGETFIGVDPEHGKRPARSWDLLTYRGMAAAPAPETPESMKWLDED